MSEKICCAIVGTGRIGSSLEDDAKREKPATHAGAIYFNRKTKLIAGADTNVENLHTFGKRWHIPEKRLYTDLSSMLEETKPGILHIATNTDAHIDNLYTAIKYKIPLVVLEKPVADTIENAKGFLSFFSKDVENINTQIVVNHERRFSADYMYVLTQIEKGIHGRLLSINAKLFLGRTKRPKDVLWHDGTHMIDVIRLLTQSEIEPGAIHGNPWSKTGNVFLIGEIRNIKSAVSGDCTMVLECSPARDYLQFELDLSFEKGRIKVGNGVFEESHSRQSPYYEAYRSLQETRKPFPWSKRQFKKTGYFANMMAHVVELYENKYQFNRSTFQDGIAAINTIQSFLDLSTFEPEAE